MGAQPHPATPAGPGKRLARDAQFALEMSYCGPRGVPHLHFLGGPPGWTQHDRDAALAWHLEERERCPSCGTHPRIWDEERGGDPFMLAAAPTHCRGCEVLIGGQETFEKERGQYRRGTSIQLRPPPTEEEEVPDGADDLGADR